MGYSCGLLVNPRPSLNPCEVNLGPPLLFDTQWGLGLRNKHSCIGLCSIKEASSSPLCFGVEE